MATWTHGTAGRVTTADFARDVDFAEICEAINRRRLLVYVPEEDFAAGGYFDADAPITEAPIDEMATPFLALRRQFTERIIEPEAGGLGGTPPSPSAMHWLWPDADADEGKIIIAGGVPGPGEVHFFDRMNGTGTWTDPVLDGATWIAAAHLNELRWSLEKLTRGRWEMPIYFAAGIFSQMPDTPWFGEAIANNGTDELRTLGFARLRTDDSPPRGLTNVTVRDTSQLLLTADTDCQVELYRCLRPLDYVGDPPTWNEYAPTYGLAWEAPGCGGPSDRELIGALSLTAGVEDSLTGPAVAAALQAMIDGAEQSFMVRRGDPGPETLSLTGRLAVELDLNVPPN